MNNDSEEPPANKPQREHLTHHQISTLIEGYKNYVRTEKLRNPHCKPAAATYLHIYNDLNGLNLKYNTCKKHFRKVHVPEFDRPPARANQKVSRNTSLKHLTYMYIADAIAKKNNADYQYTNETIIGIARTIDAYLMHNDTYKTRNLKKYKTPTINTKWLYDFKRTYSVTTPEIFDMTKGPSEARAAEITQILQEKQALDPTLCQTLEVYYMPEIGGYGLRTTAPIAKGKLVDIYDGYKHVPTILRDGLRDTTYVYDDRAHGAYADASPATSCFSRHANENLPDPDLAVGNFEPDNCRLVSSVSKHRIEFRTICDVEANTPLTAMYGIEYWEHLLRGRTLPLELHARLMAYYASEIEKHEMDLPLTSAPYNPDGHALEEPPSPTAEYFQKYDAGDMPSSSEEEAEAEAQDPTYTPGTDIL